ncbi:MAG: hypothetical protein ACLTZT_00640 [Butyricimonas faecalis]
MIDYQINPKYKSLEKAILDIPRRFDLEGEVIDDGRNVIKVLDVEGERFNVKSFKKPNIINQFAMPTCGRERPNARSSTRIRCWKGELVPRSRLLISFIEMFSG